MNQIFGMITPIDQKLQLNEIDRVDQLNENLIPNFRGRGLWVTLILKWREKQSGRTERLWELSYF